MGKTYRQEKNYWDDGGYNDKNSRRKKKYRKYNKDEQIQQKRETKQRAMYEQIQERDSH